MVDVYRVRPRRVEARRYDPSNVGSCRGFHEWLGFEHLELEHASDAVVEVLARSGVRVIVEPGDWVVRDESGLDMFTDAEFGARFERVS